MSAAKHTPGPWVVSIGPPEHVRISPIKTRIIPADGRDMIITTAEYGVYGPRNPMEAEANANLIAAAPAMYEALTHALSVCEAEAELRGENDIDDYLGGAAGPVARMIRAALAQAEGK